MVLRWTPDTGAGDAHGAVAEAHDRQVAADAERSTLPRRILHSGGNGHGVCSVAAPAGRAHAFASVWRIVPGRPPSGTGGILNMTCTPVGRFVFGTVRRLRPRNAAEKVQDASESPDDTASVQAAFRHRRRQNRCRSGVFSESGDEGVSALWLCNAYLTRRPRSTPHGTLHAFLHVFGWAELRRTRAATCNQT